VWRNIVPTFIWKALKGHDLEIFGDGTAGRDFVYVEDLAQGVLNAFKFGASGEVYNLASGIETSVKHLAETILDNVSSSSTLRFEPKRPWDNSGRRVGDPAKSKTEISFSTTVDIEQGIARTVDWFTANLDRIDSLIYRHNLPL
jgi:nucleoside-diphosphate-sugar epimerase